MHAIGRERRQKLWLWGIHMQTTAASFNDNYSTHHVLVIIKCKLFLKLTSDMLADCSFYSYLAIWPCFFYLWLCTYLQYSVAWIGICWLDYCPCFTALFYVWVNVILFSRHIHYYIRCALYQAYTFLLEKRKMFPAR